MVESVESTLHRSRLKARPSSKPSPPSPCEASSFQSNARHSFARFASAASHPRYFIVNSHESQCHRVKESFSHPSLSGKQESVGNFHLGRAFSSLDFDSPSLSPPFETRHSPILLHLLLLLLFQICPYFTFDANRREITRGIGGEEFSGKRNDRKPRFIRIINIGSAVDFQL